MTIGRLAYRTGVSVDTLRFYERKGLIVRPRRMLSGCRIYSAELIDRVQLVKEAKGLGCPLREIHALLMLGVKSTRECGPITRKAEAKLSQMTEEIVRLQRLRRTLCKMIRDCHGCIDGGRGAYRGLTCHK